MSDGARDGTTDTTDDVATDGTQDRTFSRRGWRLILKLTRQRRAGIALGVAVGLAWTAAKVSTGVLVRNAVDQGIIADDPGALRKWSVTLGCVAVASAVFTGLRRYVAFREARWVEAHLRDRLFAHLQRLHFAFHDRAQTGQLMSRANTDLQQVQAFVVMIPLTISNFVTVLAVTVILAVIDPVLTLLALGSLPFLNVVATRFSRTLFPSVMGIQRESAELAAVVEESVAGVRVVKGLGAERVQADRLKAEAEDVYDESMAAAMTRARFLPAMELLPNLGLIAVLGYGGHQVLNGSLSLGTLIMFNVYIAMLVWPLRMLGMIVAQSQRAAVSAERVDEVLSTEPEVDDPAHPAELPRRRRRGPLRRRAVRLRPARPGARRLRPRRGAGRVGGAGRRDRVGQDHGGPAHPPVLRRRGRDRRDRRRRRPHSAVSRTCVGPSGIVFEDTFLFSDTIGANIAFADPDAPTRPSSGRPGWPAPTSSSRRCPRATPPRSASAATRCRAGSASASPSPGPSWPTPGC